MRCTAAVVESLSLALTRPVVIGDHNLRVRRGLRLHLRDAAGQHGRGDILPLPGLSVADLAAAQAQVAALVESLPEHDPRAWVTGDLLPSVRLGLETAIQDLAWQAGAGAARWSKRSVPLNTLIETAEDDVEAVAEARLAAGYRSLKLKVGRGDLDRDIDIVRSLRDRAAGRATLRLDANGRWSPDQAWTFARAVGSTGIEYLEEPTADSATSLALCRDTGLALAVDARAVADCVVGEPVTTWVLKPLILGGLGVIQTLCARAREAGVRVVLSSAFESGHALRTYGRLALALGLESCQGLDTGRWLADDPEVPVVRDGALLLEDPQHG